MPTISQNEKTKSEEFMELLHELLGVIDDFSEVIGDGNYLKCCNILKKIQEDAPISQLNQPQTPQIVRVYVQSLVRQVRSNQVVVEHENRRNMPLRKKQMALTDAQKVSHSDYCRCGKCDRFVLKAYLKEHQRNDVCLRIKDTKGISKSTGVLDTTDYSKAITLLRRWCVKTGRCNKYF